MISAVDPNPSGMTDIHDIKPALVFEAHWPWWGWLAVAAAMVAVAALLWWWRTKRRNIQRQAPSTPAVPPDVEAFQSLDRLAAGGSGDPKQFYFHLSAILRHYVERRFEFPAAEMTTEELLPRMRQMALSQDLARELTSFCHNSDPIKFADAAADPTGMGGDLAFVRKFVEDTTRADGADEAQHNPEPEAATMAAHPSRHLPPSKEIANP